MYFFHVLGIHFVALETKHELNDVNFYHFEGLLDKCILVANRCSKGIQAEIFRENVTVVSDVPLDDGHEPFFLQDHNVVQSFPCFTIPQAYELPSFVIISI